ITNNKLLVSITSAVTLFTFVIFTVIAANSGSTSSSGNSTTSGSTSSQIADNDSSTSGDESSDTSHTTRPVPETPVGSETTEDKDKPTTTTKPKVDPNTLPYLVKVNRAANCLTVYEKDDKGKFTVPVKAITVSCGRDLEDNATPLGTFHTIIHYDWRLMFDGTYSQFAYRIVGSILFHSVPYYSTNKGDLEWEEFNKLGSPASMGCIRMTVADSLWLIDNCPIGTRVIIYDDAENPGPLGKPDTIKIPEDSEHRGWDPTDPDPDNPWHKYHASISHPSTKRIMVEEGTSMDAIRSYFKGYDKCGNDISHKLMFVGNINLDEVGIYSMTVKLEDATGSKATVDITIHVTPKEEPTTPDQGETPSEKPSEKPSETPSEKPSETPSENPSESPSENPSETPSENPSESPSENPSENSGENASGAAESNEAA
ncbi:MAG: L,D-transpeptidase family protein, partial [Lachnospiraceae bacterium]|nr:L,D-transpeptidase family protein [Lachnospiraceae bacterium]